MCALYTSLAGFLFSSLFIPAVFRGREKTGRKAPILILQPDRRPQGIFAIGEFVDVFFKNKQSKQKFD